jgi:hypothetical protein
MENVTHSPIHNLLDFFREFFHSLEFFRQLMIHKQNPFTYSCLLRLNSFEKFIKNSLHFLVVLLKIDLSIGDPVCLDLNLFFKQLMICLLIKYFLINGYDSGINLLLLIIPDSRLVFKVSP